MKGAEDELHELLKEEKIWLAQCSRANWLKHGDRNTKFFHYASQRKHRNWADSILDDARIFYEDEEKIGSIMTEYFIQLFSSGETEHVEEVVEVVKGIINTKMLTVLNANFPRGEIIGALKQMPPTKASPFLLENVEHYGG